MMWVCSSGEIYLSTSLDSFRFNAFLDFLKTFQSYGLIFAQMRFGLIISNLMFFQLIENGFYAIEMLGALIDIQKLGSTSV